MKQIRNMSQVELAAYVQDRLVENDIVVILSGGTAATFYSKNKYISKDLDLINTHFVKRSRIRTVLEKVGFHEKGRYFTHPETPYFIEFPDGPLSVGEEPVKVVDEFELATGTLRVISATDCVKDRLCAYYFWNDQQGLAQAILVSKSQPVDLGELHRWSIAEGKEQEFEMFRNELGE